MSWLSRTERVVVTDLEAVAKEHQKTHDELDSDYKAGLSILNGVRKRAAQQVQQLDAVGRQYLRAAESIGDRFLLEPPPTIPAKVQVAQEHPEFHDEGDLDV